MNFSDILNDIELEQRRRLFILLEQDSRARALWSRALSALPDDVDRDWLDHAFWFAKWIKYSHLVLSREIYFLHSGGSILF